MDDELFDDDEDDNLFISFKTSVNVIRVIDQELIPTEILLKVDFANDPGPDLEDQFAILSCQAAMAKIRYWLSDRLDGCIMYSHENEWAEEALSSSENRNCVLPGEPNEDILVLVLHSKMQALGGDLVKVGPIDIEMQDGYVFTYVGDGLLELPDQEEWGGDTALFAKPWWARADGSTKEEQDINKLGLTEEYIKEMGFEQPVEDSLDFISTEIFKNSDHTAEIIRPSFRPLVIIGDKRD